MKFSCSPEITLNLADISLLFQTVSQPLCVLWNISRVSWLKVLMPSVKQKVYQSMNNRPSRKQEVLVKVAQLMRYIQNSSNLSSYYSPLCMALHTRRSPCREWEWVWMCPAINLEVIKSWAQRLWKCMCTGIIPMIGMLKTTVFLITGIVLCVESMLISQ